MALVAGLTQEVVGPIPRQLKHVQAGEQAPTGGAPILLNGVPAGGSQAHKLCSTVSVAASRCMLLAEVPAATGRHWLK